MSNYAPDETDEIQVNFPNGKSVPLSRINKPHARIPGHTVPGPNDDPDEWWKKKNEEREKHKAEMAKMANESAAKDTVSQDAEKTGESTENEGSDKNKSPFPETFTTPSGRQIPMSRILSPHAPVFNKENKDSSGLLHTGGHRPQGN